MSKTYQIKWFESEYGDRYLVHTGKANGGLCYKAEWIATISGTLYACVRNDGKYHTHFDTYRIGRDGIGKKANHGFASRPIHYEEHEDKTVILKDCNWSGESPRIRPCTMCKAHEEAVAKKNAWKTKKTA